MPFTAIRARGDRHATPKRPRLILYSERCAPTGGACCFFASLPVPVFDPLPPPLPGVPDGDPVNMLTVSFRGPADNTDCVDDDNSAETGTCVYIIAVLATCCPDLVARTNRAGAR